MNKWIREIGIGRSNFKCHKIIGHTSLNLEGFCHLLRKRRKTVSIPLAKIPQKQTLSFYIVVEIKPIDYIARHKMAAAIWPRGWGFCIHMGTPGASKWLMSFRKKSLSHFTPYGNKWARGWVPQTDTERQTHTLFGFWLVMIWKIQYNTNQILKCRYQVWLEEIVLKYTLFLQEVG